MQASYSFDPDLPQATHTMIPLQHPKSFIYLLTFLSTLGGFLFGYDTGVVSGAMILIKSEFKLTTHWHEAIVSGTIAAAWIFSLIAGWLADKFGRKPVILFASILFTAGSVVMSLANGKELLLVGRIIVGIGIGFSSACVPLYWFETASVSLKEKLTFKYPLFIAFGHLSASSLAGICASQSAIGWRYMLGLAAIPAAIQFFGFLGMPESPRWLVSKQRFDEALRVLRSIRAPNSRIELELESIKAGISEETPTGLEGHSIFVHIFVNPTVRRALFIGCLLQAIQQVTGINTVMYYSASIIQMAGINEPSMAIWLAALPAGMNFLCTFIGLLLVDRLGRRPLVLWSLAGVIIALVTLGIGFRLMNIYSPEITSIGDCGIVNTCSACITSASNCGFCYGSTNTTSCWKFNTTSNLPFSGPCSQPLNIHNFNYDWCPSQFSWIIIASLCLYLLLFAPGMGTMPWTINSEIYPMWARSSCNSLATSTNWFCNLIISMTFLTLSKSLTIEGAFYLYASFGLVGFILFMIILPETKGKSLEEMESLFMHPLFSSSLRRKNVQYVQIRGLNRDCHEDRKDSDESDS